MRRLLEEILLYAKPLTLDLETLRLNPLLRGFVETHRELGAPRRQEIELVENSGDVCIVGDADRMRQILANLTENACNAAPEGAVIRWHIGDQETENRVLLELRNPGPGIPPELTDRIMEPFVSTKGTRTGLGLVIVKRLVETQGAISRSAREPEGGPVSAFGFLALGTTNRTARHMPMELVRQNPCQPPR